MTPCEFAGRHSPPPGHDGHSNYACTICAADVRPAVLETPRQAEAPPPDFGQSVRFVVTNPRGLDLKPGNYYMRMGNPHPITGIYPLEVIGEIVEDNSRWRQFDNGEDGNGHVMPIDDLREHIESPNCPCGGKFDPECAGLFVHASFDGREHYEVGQRKAN